MKKNILATLTYSDIFDYPLVEDEIWKWIIFENLKSKILNLKFKEDLNSLVKEKRIETKSGFYFLPGRIEILETRKRREGWSKIKFEKAKKVSFWLQFIPWIRFIGISGGLALNNAEHDDDIDFFFITNKNRIWLTRAIVVSFLTVFGWYRRPKIIADKICPNFFIDESHLEIKPHDLYTAHEVAQLVPLVDKKIHASFLKDNLWAKEYLPNVIESKKYNLKSKIGNEKKPEILLFTFYFIDIIENLLMNLQLKFMAKKRTIEVTSPSLIKFHPSDMHNVVLEKYRQKMAADR